MGPITQQRWSQIESVFLRATELPASQRSKYLEEACAGDGMLRREVDALLACDKPEVPLIEPVLPGPEPLADLAGRRIGVYRLVRMLGHGGMGSVYLAVRDDDQFHMEVAIKLLKRGMDTDFMLGRFRQERQILANMEHPFIARLLDGGATDDGLPYFVMEYVDGLPITKYCAEKYLDLTERLRLFRLVCEAVQHAHQNLVVHRDLKPGNILITKEGIPKLLDFGIAKWIDPATGTDAHTLTRRDLQMMTPAYASPEQVLGLNINTSTDIYSLGAILYELLSGKRPHRFVTETPAEIEKVICQVEPERPSLACGNRRLSGDLDNIVLTAMRKEPQRRYASVAELSDDLRRHLEGMPVTAREDQWTYRAGKFIGRHRLGVATGILVLASLIGGIVATKVQASRSERRFQLVRNLAGSLLFDYHDRLERMPGSTGSRAILVQTIVGYLDSLARDTGSDPTLDLEIADAYRRAGGLEGHPFRQNLGQTAAALDHYRKAIGIYERLTNQPAVRYRAIQALIGSHLETTDIQIRSGRLAEANDRLQKAVAIAAQASARDARAVSAESWSSLYSRLGDAELRRGAPEGALPYFQKAVEASRNWSAGDLTLNAQNTFRNAVVRLATAHSGAGDLVRAREYVQTSLKAAEDLSRRSDATIDTRHGLINAHQTLGDLLGGPEELNFGDREGALRHYREAASIAEQLAAADELDVRARDDLQSAYRRIGSVLLEERPAEALEYCRKALGIVGTLSEANIANLNLRRDLAASRLALGEALQRSGKTDEALDYMRSALDGMQRLIAEVPDQIFWIETLARAHSDIGGLLLDRGDDSGAFGHLWKGLEATEKLLKSAPSNLHFQRDQADAFESLGRHYARLALRPGTPPTRRTEWNGEARLWNQKSQRVWMNWTHRKVGNPYSVQRQARVAELLKIADSR